MDEIHRFNKAQQDAFLPHVGKGEVTLIGATTENPSFRVIGPLLSRCQVYTLNINQDELKKVAQMALEDREKGLGGRNLAINQEALDFLVDYSNGDARTVLNTLEAAAEVIPEGKSITTRFPPLLNLNPCGDQILTQRCTIWHE